MYTSGGDPDSVSGEFGRHPLYKMLGYFSLIGLLRLHSLLGDYYQALKVSWPMFIFFKIYVFHFILSQQIMLTIIKNKVLNVIVFILIVLLH